jgi:hypothetical protein
MREAGRALTLPAEAVAASLVESIAEAYLRGDWPRRARRSRAGHALANIERR